MGSGTTPSSSTASFYNEGTIPWINTGDLPDGPVLENKQKRHCSLLAVSVMLSSASVCLSVARYTITDFKG